MSKLKTNILYNLLYQVIVLVVPLVTAPYLSRVFNSDGTGTYSYVSSIAYYFFIFITLGLNNYGNRCVAKTNKDAESLSRVFFSIYFLQLFLGCLISLLYLGYVYIFVETSYKLFFLLYFPYILSAIVDINWFFYGLSEFKFTTIRSTIVKLLSLVAIFCLVKEKDDLYLYFLVMGGSYLLSNLLLWTRLKNYVSFYKPSFKEVVVHIKPNLVLFVPILAISIYRVMDKIMITELSDVVQNGYYENADKIITMSLTGFSAVATVMMPSAAALVAAGKKDKITQLLRDTMQTSLGLGIGMMCGLLAIGVVFAPIYFGSEFLETGYLIQFLSITIIISGWKAVLRSQYLIPYEKDKSYVISLIAGAVVNVICNIIFIPMWAARGAVIGTLIAETVGLLIQTYVASKDVNIFVLLKDSLVFVPSGIMMYMIVSQIVKVTSGVSSIIISIVIGALVYIVFSVISLRVFCSERWKYLKVTYLRKKVN